jgi:hypothetical protein
MEDILKSSVLPYYGYGRSHQLLVIIIIGSMWCTEIQMLTVQAHLDIPLIQNKSDTTQFLWVTIDPTYKLTTGKLSVQYALFTYISICSFWFFNSEYSNLKKKSIASPEKWNFLSCVTFLLDERYMEPPVQANNVIHRKPSPHWG